MDVYCRGTARIRHHLTGEIYDIENGELTWDSVESRERKMGPEIHHEAIVEHPQLGGLTWGLWEYPIGVENDRETNAGRHEVIENFDYGLQPDEWLNYPDEWLNYTVPDNPFTIFMDSYHHTVDLLAEHGKDDGDHLLNRMVFSQQVTALEAYLGDTLIKKVMADRSAMQRLIEQDDDLAKEKFTLAEISKEPGLVERKIREHLRSILYHNLKKVSVLYNIALGFRILPPASNKEKLFNAVRLRHDCVHRNGFDKDGNKHEVFTKTFVQNTADLIKAFVEEIEKAVQAQSAGRS